MVSYGFGICYTMALWKATKTHHIYTTSYPLLLIWLAAMGNQVHCP
jgi:hypothetical protein